MSETHASGPTSVATHATAPGVTIVIPTFNSEHAIVECLESVFSQVYPGKVEVIVADGGSTDRTLSIVRRYGNVRSIHNRLRTGEAGKAAGAKCAVHEIVAFIDSDNVLPSQDWLGRMMATFADPDIAAAEPLYYEYRERDGPITRYCALIGMNDPLCLFLGNYDRYSQLTGRWTAVPLETLDCGDYIRVVLSDSLTPTIGANGFIVRKNLLSSAGIGEYLFDVDLVSGIASSRQIVVAKVKIGIVHIFAKDIADFARKQRRRVRDFLIYKDRRGKSYPWQESFNEGVLRFILSTIVVFPLLVQMYVGHRRRRDVAWLFHLPACFLTLAIYGAFLGKSFLAGIARGRRPGPTGA